MPTLRLDYRADIGAKVHLTASGFTETATSSREAVGSSLGGHAVSAVVHVRYRQPEIRATQRPRSTDGRMSTPTDKPVATNGHGNRLERKERRPNDARLLQLLLAMVPRRLLRQNRAEDLRGGEGDAAPPAGLFNRIDHNVDWIAN